MEFDKESLWMACYRIANEKAYEGRPVDVKVIKRLADILYANAIFYHDYLEGLNVDPNVLVRAVRYLGSTHTNPYLNDDQRLISWFSNSLDILIELVSPNVEITCESAQFLKDVHAGVSRILGPTECQPLVKTASSLNDAETNPS